MGCPRHCRLSGRRGCAGPDEDEDGGEENGGRADLEHNLLDRVNGNDSDGLEEVEGLRVLHEVLQLDALELVHRLGRHVHEPSEDGEGVGGRRGPNFNLERVRGEGVGARDGADLDGVGLASERLNVLLLDDLAAVLGEVDIGARPMSLEEKDGTVAPEGDQTASKSQSANKDVGE